VSRALRENDLVQEETRQRIRAIALQQGYTPNAAARTLSSRRSKTIGISSKMLQDYPFSDILRGIVSGGYERGYVITLVGHNNQSRTVHFQEILRAYREGRVDGYISNIESDEVPKWVKSAIPCVGLENYGIKGLPVVHHDRIAAGQEMTGHLLSLGHRRVALLGNSSSSMPDLIEGYRRAYAEIGVPFSPELVLRYPEIEGRDIDAKTPEGYGRLVDAGVQLVLAERPTAVVFHYTQRAMFALRTFKTRGIRVPEDIAIVSLADQPGSYNTDPALTVWQGDYVAMGRQSALMLVDQIEGKGETGVPMTIKIPGKLIIREGCGAKRN
jgi:DNA-binding LacI/PurR family transcriptional regulator